MLTTFYIVYSYRNIEEFNSKGLYNSLLEDNCEGTIFNTGYSQDPVAPGCSQGYDCKGMHKQRHD